MVLGAVWCPIANVREISVRLREIKREHGLSPSFEAKWQKISPAGSDIYLSLLDYFFDDDDLHFRSLVVPDKSLIDHESFDQSHDDWYFKMYFQLIKAVIVPTDRYRIYLDIKDTHSASKVRRLHSVLANSLRDFEREIVLDLQTVRSHEVELLQLTDLLIGAVAYANRGLTGNSGKLDFVQRLQERSRYSLKRTTLLREEKVNILIWQASSTED